MTWITRIDVPTLPYGDQAERKSLSDCGNPGAVRLYHFGREEPGKKKQDRRNRQ